MIAEGDTVEIMEEDGYEEWAGLRATIQQISLTQVWLEPLSPRPDGHEMKPFYWLLSRVQKVT